MAEPSENSVTHLDDMSFDLSQSFYSRTDKKDVILAGNTAFRAITGFEWDQLLGAPHKIVRSPETPRAVFRVMRNLLQADKVAVSYVRNKTYDGRGYWVLALALPTEDGYFYVRIKPTSPHFEKIVGMYRNIAAFEQNQTESSDASDAQFLSEITALGFADYPAFQTSALLAEFRARSLALSPKMKSYFTDIDRINQGLHAIKAAQGELLTAVESLRDLPTNMRIVASRLEPSGGPLSAMSDIYNATSSVLFQEITDFALGQTSISKRMGEAFEKSCFFKAVCLLIEEVMLSTSHEDLSDAGIDSKAETENLAAILAQYMGTEREALQNAERLAQDLNRASYDLRRSMLGLDTIRVMGLVESGRLGAEGSRIGATMEQIGACHGTIIGLLQGIKDNATIVNAGVSALRMHFQKRGALAAN